MVACGADHMAALTNDGTVYTWGCGGNGRLGHGHEQDVKKPQRVEAISNAIIFIACGGYRVSLSLQHAQQQPVTTLTTHTTHTSYHMGAITDDNTLLLWGWNAYGQCGVELKGGDGGTENILAPRHIDRLTNVLQLSCGESHTAVLISD